MRGREGEREREREGRVAWGEGRGQCAKKPQRGWGNIAPDPGHVLSELQALQAQAWCLPRGNQSSPRIDPADPIPYIAPIITLTSRGGGCV